ncbi:MAG: hypothetical protein JM58_19245 [Peptococcaceae bacterium BICA1-8]|nr:MAG: hypothetical protein JM58_19245 [Peptococcaceae bacterium BICA1-8]
MEDNYILGLDIGGTSIKAGIVNQWGGIKSFQTIPTNSHQGPDHVLAAINTLIQSYQGQKLINGIGIALAGSIDNKAGVCIYSPNLNWRNIAIGKIIEESTGLEVRLINDANAACLGEYFFGAGRNQNNIICIIIGTGIGSAIILDNKLFTGNSGLAPEAGHMVLIKDGPQCSCGGKGCWETLVSASAIVKRVAEKSKSGTYTISPHTIQDIFKAWQAGDCQVVKIMTEVKEYLALGLANLVNIFDPECIVLGGGIIELDSGLTEGLEDMVKEFVFPSFKDTLLIRKAELGNKAGLVGGASLFLKESELNE